MSMFERIIECLERIHEQGSIPCLRSIEVDEEHKAIMFRYRRLDLAKLEDQPDARYTGAVWHIGEHANGYTLALAVPSILDTSETSARDDLMAFSSALLACAAPSAKFLIANGNLHVALDLALPHGLDDDQLELVMHEAVRRIIRTHLIWCLYMWKHKADGVLPSEALTDAIKERLDLIAEYTGDDPIGGQIAGAF